MGYPTDPTLRAAAKRAEYERNKGRYLGRTKAYKKTERGRITDRNWRLKSLYGITGEQWDAMSKEQGGLCAICRAAPIKHTDHDHSTGKVRGLLCHGCNVGLGAFRDDDDLMVRAIAYLTRNKAPQPK
jgi:hypothetical protein